MFSDLFERKKIPRSEIPELTHTHTHTMCEIFVDVSSASGQRDGPGGCPIQRGCNGPEGPGARLHSGLSVSVPGQEWADGGPLRNEGISNGGWRESLWGEMYG